MAVSKTFIHAWHKWIQLTIPTKNLDLNSAKTPGYEIELDHLRSCVYFLGNEIIGGRNYDFIKLATEELEKLNEISLEIESCEIAETEKREIRDYISFTRMLLEEIKTSFL
jgi:hypothetical protein